MKKSFIRLLTIVAVGAMTICTVPSMEKAFASENTINFTESFDVSLDNNAQYNGIISEGKSYRRTVNEQDTNFIAEESKEASEKRLESCKLSKDKYNVYEDFAYIEVNGGVALISYLGDDGDVEIPSTIDDKDVVVIGGYAFYNNKTIKSVTIPDTVKYIQNFAFNTSSIESIDVPDSVEQVTDTALAGANKLKTATFGKGIVAFNHCTDHCSSLESISINKSNKYYTSADGVLYNKQKNILVQYPDSKEGEEYTVPENVEYINLLAFNGNKTIKTLNIDKTLKVIGQVAFSETNLETINFPEDGEISIEGCAFSWNKNLKNVDIKGVTQIGRYAFRECGLVDVSINKDIQKLGGEVFNSCKDLEKLQISNKDAEISKDLLWCVRDTLEEANTIIEIVDDKAPAITETENESQSTKKEENKSADEEKADADEEDANSSNENEEKESQKIPDVPCDENKESVGVTSAGKVNESGKSGNTGDLASIGSIIALAAASGVSIKSFKKRK